MKILISTTMRVGSTWVGIMTEDLLKLEGLHFIDAHKKLGLYTPPTDSEINEMSLYIDNVNSNYWLKSHLVSPASSLRLTKLNPEIRIINIHRGIEDTLASRFYYGRYHQFETVGKSEILSKLGEKNSKLSDEECLNYLINESDIVCRWYNNYNIFHQYYENERFITLKYEKLRCADKDEFKKLINFIEVKLSNDQLIDFIEKHSFQKYQTKEIEETGRIGSRLFSRKGEIGSGKSLFTQEVMEAIKKKCKY